MCTCWKQQLTAGVVVVAVKQHSTNQMLASASSSARLKSYCAVRGGSNRFRNWMTPTIRTVFISDQRWADDEAGTLEVCRVCVCIHGVRLKIIRADSLLLYSGGAAGPSAQRSDIDKTIAHPVLSLSVCCSAPGATLSGPDVTPRAT